MYLLAALFLAWILTRLPRFQQWAGDNRALDHYANMFYQRFNSRQNILSVIALVILIFIAGLVQHLCSHFAGKAGSLVFEAIILAYGISSLKVRTAATVVNSPREVFSLALAGSFTLIFWFILGGVLFVVLYLYLRTQNTENTENRILLKLLEWPAVRVLALGYALAGYFPKAFAYGVANVWRPMNFNQSFIETAGLLALYGGADGGEINNKDILAARALVKRAQVMLLILFVLYLLVYHLALLKS